MKLMKTQDAVGQVLCHDITQIIKRRYQGCSFSQRTCDYRRRYSSITKRWKRQRLYLGKGRDQTSRK